MINYKETKHGFLIDVYVQPKASHNKIKGEYNNALKIYLTSPPIEGAANKECIKLLSKTLNISKSQVIIKRGEHSRKKQILVKGIALEKIIELIK